MSSTCVPSASKQYINNINRQCPERLTPEKSIELGRVMKTGTEQEALEARNQLIEGHLIYAVKYVQNRFPDASETLLEELIQSANMGLFRAAQNYDYTQNLAFSTYAASYMCHEVSLCYHNYHSIVSINDWYARFLVAFHALPDYEEHESVEDIAALLKIAPQTAEAVLFYHQSSKGTLPYSAIQHVPAIDEAAELAADEDLMKEVLRIADKFLTTDEKTVLFLKTQIWNTYNGKTLVPAQSRPGSKNGEISFENIAAAMGSSKEIAWNRYQRAVKKIKKHLDINAAA